MNVPVTLFPCSASQTRLWLLERLGRGGSALVVRAPLVLDEAVLAKIKLDGAVLGERSRDPAAVQRHVHAAVQALVRRHESLRTTFAELDGQPVQRVHDDLDLPVPVTDLHGLPRVRRRQRLRALADATAGEPFDLARGPLLRAHLVLGGPRSAVLLLVLHHIVVDGWSVRIIHDELTALVTGTAASELAPLRVQYADYALWQAEQRATSAYRERLRWWHALHADAPQRRALFPGPATPRPPAASHRPAARRLERHLDPAVVQRLRALAAEHRATLFGVLLAAFAGVLHAHTGEDDLVVGTPVAGRTHPDLEPLVGFFVNTLPLRLRVAAEPFGVLLDRVRDLAADAFERQDVPYEEIARGLVSPDRVLFDVMLNLLEGRALPAASRLPATPGAPTAVAGAHSDLELYVLDEGDAVRLELVHARAHVPDGLAERLLDDVVALLAEVDSRTVVGRARSAPRAASPPAAPPPVPARHAPTVDWPAAGEATTLGERILEVARRHPDRPAVRDSSAGWTYGELTERALALGDEVRAAGGTGGRVGVLVSHDAHAVLAIVGVLLAGAAYVPLDPRSPAARLADIADDAGLALVLTGPGVRAEAAALAERRPGLRWYDVGDLPAAGRGENDRPPPPGDPDALAYLIYTSGTTGTPKGVMQSHRNVLGNVRTYAEALGLGPPDALSLLAGVGTDAAVMDVFGALLTGASVHPVDLSDVALDELGRRLAEHGVTVLHTTPSVFRGLAAQLEDPARVDGDPLDAAAVPPAGSSLSGVRLLVLGGEPATRGDLAAFARHLPGGAVLVNGYGPTECTVATQLFADRTTSVATEALPLGGPVAHVDMRLADDAGTSVIAGGVGEIVLTGPYVALGYWQRPAETARAFAAGPDGGRTYRTGDLARVHPDGALTFAGRLDDQVKVRGIRVEPAEIEAALRRQEGVLAAGVTARSPLTAHLVLAPGHQPSPSRVRRALRRLLPEPMVPSRYVVVDRLPLTASGKIDRRALASLGARELRDPPAGDAAGVGTHQDPGVATVAAIWAEVLDVDAAEITPADTFFDFGGHSLLLTQVAARLADRLGVRLPLRTLFENPTLADLAARVRDGRGGVPGPPANAADGDGPGEDRIRPRTTPGPYPLSSAQARLWFLEELNPGSATYAMSVALPVGPAARRDDVQTVLDELIARHESLRTTFEVLDGQPLQRVRQSGSVPVRESDLSSLGPEAPRRSDEIAVETASSGFDLRRGPLLRAHLVRLGAAGGYLHLALHHIVADGWSLRLLREEFEALLAARVEGRPSLLAPTALQYVDVVLWERSRPGRLDAGLRWWAETLAGAPALLELPTCRPRPRVPTSRGSLVSAALPQAVVRSCRRLARRRGATPFMVYLAAFAAVLHRWSGNQDLVVGAPVAGRTRVETEDVVGLFVNSLPLRLAVAPEESFLDLLDAVREVVTAAQDHQDVPLEEIVRRVAPQRSLAYAPVFQVMFALGSTQSEHGPAVAHTATAKFDLSLTVDDGAAPAVYLEYAADLYDEAAARLLLQATVEVLTEVAAEPARPVSHLRLAPEALDLPAGPVPERARGAVTAGPPANGLGQRLAVTGPGTATTHAELAARVAALARAVRDGTPGPGSVVAVDLPRGSDLVAGILAVRAAGRVLLLLDPRLPTARRVELLRRSDAALVLDAAVLAGALDAPAAHDGSAGRDPEGGPQTPAYVVATSGSTGVPKLVFVPRRALAAQVAALADAYGLTPDDRVLQVASLGFDVALEEILPTLAVGGSVELGPGEAPASFAELDALCAPGGVTVLNLPASYWHEWVGYLEGPGGGRLPAGLRLVVVGSEPVSPQVVARWHLLTGTCRLLCAYGTSETTITNALYEPPRERDWLAEARTPIGTALPTGRLLVVDPLGRPVPPGTLGELVVEGDCLASGYLDAPDLTAERFVPGLTGPRYLTGDLARERFDGAVEVVGRLDRQLKLAGHRIEPGEVEAALLRRPGVATAAVDLRDGPDGRPRLVGYVVPPDRERPPAAADLRDALLRELPEHLVPTAYVVLDALPRTSNGKLDRARLPRPAAVPAEREGPAPAGLELEVAQVWADTLRIPLEAISASSNFFALGGDSILSLQVAWRLGERGMAVSLAEVFEHQSVAELAACLAGRAKESAAVRQGGAEGTGDDVGRSDAAVDADVPLTPIQHWQLAAGSPAPGHDNQAILLRLDDAVTTDHLRAALRTVVATHDALRSRFERSDGGWHARVVADPDSSFALTVHPAGASRDDVAARAHACLDLARGPLLRAEVVPDDAGRALLLVAHHLVVDVVSWQIIRSDLAAALGALREGAAPELLRLPPVPTSWTTWARRLREWARGDDAGDQVRGWLARAPRADALVRLPATGHEASAGTAADERVVRVRLPAGPTEALLLRAPQVLGARIEEAVLAAVATAVAGAGGTGTEPATDRTVLVDVEGHGREPVLPDLDVSRTVGWFTSLRPVPVHVGAGPSVLGTVRAAAQALRATPALACGAVRYLRDARDPLAAALSAVPDAQVCVNYLGRLDPAAGSAGLLRPAGPAPGPARSPRAPRPYALDVVVGVRDGELVLWLAYAGPAIDPPVAEALARACTSALQAIAAACDGATVGQRAAGDASAQARPLASYPLTPMQDAMLHGAQATAGTGVYVEHSVLRLPGLADAAALRRAWERAVARHDVLRTRFVEDSGGARRQEVMAGAALPWRVADWRHLPEDEARERLEGLLEDDRRRGFDPAQAPLMRVVLVRLPGGDRLVWSHHHAILDGWSAATVLAEVGAAIEPVAAGGRPVAGIPRAAGADPAEPVPPRPYGDFVRWLDDRDHAADAAHWAAELADLPAPGEAPGGRLPTHDVEGLRPRAAALAADVPRDVVGDLRERAKSLRVSAATLVHAAWALVLREHTRSDDVVLGVTSSGRPTTLAGAEHMVGVFITTHPARVRLPADLRLADLAADLAVREAANREHAHAGLVAIARWAGLPPGTPLFESLLVVENYRRGDETDSRSRHGGEASPVDAALEPAGADGGPVREVPVREIPDVPLSVVVAPDLSLTIVYDARRFDGAWVADVLRALRTAVQAIASASADARVRDLDVLAPTVRRRLLEDWNATQRPVPRLSLGAQWVGAARRHAEAVAVDSPDGPVTYARLAAAADRVQARLRARGARPGDLVGVMGHRSADLVAAVLGVVRAGCAYVPLDPAYPDERLAYLVADTGMRLVLAESGLVPRLPAEVRDDVVPIDGVLEADGEPCTDVVPHRDRDPDVDAPAYVIYTSGSTGRPKGVVVPHRAVTRLVVNTDYCRLGPQDAVAFASTFAFDASTFEIWGALLTGARLVPIDADTVLDPGRLAGTLRSRGVTTIFLTTAAFNAVAAARPDAFTTLTTVLFGGERVDPRRVRDVLLAGPPRRLVHVYGPTEATTFASWHEVRAVAEGARTVPIGRPIANTTLLVLDDAGGLVPPGVEGELAIGGPGLALGYLGDPALTAQRFVPHPFAPGELLYRTGDVVLRRSDGTIEIRGRRDNQVKIRGFRIEPGEVETHLLRAPGVAAAVVVARREAAEVHFLAAYVVGEPGTRLSEPDLRAWLRARLPEHLVPTTLTILPRLPLTANGKVDRDALPDPRGDVEVAAGARPATEAEIAVARIWAQVLAMDVDVLTAERDFFELGGHSLLLTQVATRLRRELGVDVPLRVLFEVRTLRALAAVVESADQALDGEIPVADRTSYRATLDESGRLVVPPVLRERLRQEIG